MSLQHLLQNYVVGDELEGFIEDDSLFTIEIK